MNLAGCEAGIIYENMDGSGDFQPIAFIENGQAIETSITVKEFVDEDIEYAYNCAKDLLDNIVEEI